MPTKLIAMATALETAKDLLAQNRLADAHEVLWALVRTTDERVHEAWLRLGELFVARRQLRRAVGAFRRAQELDARGEYAFLLHQAVSSLGQVLHHQGRPFLHPADELVRTRHLVAVTAPAVPTVDAWLRDAEALRGTLPLAGRVALDHAETFVRHGRLDESFSEQSVARELELKAGEAAKPLSDSLRALHLSWYEALLAAEEP
jgi:tetratricopeptide (TPR) repeat protein